VFANAFAASSIEKMDEEKRVTRSGRKLWQTGEAGFNVLNIAGAEDAAG
jgi:hypothetical protein